MQNQFPQRKSPRLQGYDYSQNGAYFVTVVTHLRGHLFGTVGDGDVALSEIGTVVSECWHAIPRHHPHVTLDAFIVMPNHIHGIIVLHDDDGHSVTDGIYAVPTGHDDGVGTPYMASAANKLTPSLGVVMGTFKAAVTRRVNRMMQHPPRVWQGRYHDRIIRNEDELNRIREYVVNNPARWSADEHYIGGDTTP